MTPDQACRMFARANRRPVRYVLPARPRGWVCIIGATLFILASLAACAGLAWAVARLMGE